MKRDPQSGSSLIEVLVAILLLSFGMLSLGSMLSFAVQAPKLSGYRATAANLAASHIERIRANPAGFRNGSYASTLSYDGTFNDIAAVNCNYPNCSAAGLATMDIKATERAARIELPAGGMLLTCDPALCGPNSNGNLWIVWQEPTIFSTNPFSASDNCPIQVTGTFANPKPRCLYVRFRI